MTTNPGLTNQAGVRNAFRVAGPILAVVGAVICIWGLIAFIRFGDDSVNNLSVETMDEDTHTPIGQIAMFMGGFIVFAIGMGMARAGFLGVGARYVVGEVAPVAKDGLEYLTDGQGLANLGRSAATGPFCRSCGTRNDAEASFCDKCGQSLT